MVNTVKKIKASREILNITNRQDYFIISDIFFGDSDFERKSRLLKSLVQLNDPCADTGQLNIHYTHFEEKIRALNLENCNPHVFLMTLLPEVEEHFDTQFVIYKDGICIMESSNREKVIYVIIQSNADEDDIIEVTADNMIAEEKRTYKLSCVIKVTDFSKCVYFSHAHTIDIGSAEIFPFDTLNRVNTCQFSESAFSPIQTLLKIKKKLSLAKTKHTHKEIVMLIKQLCRVSENYDYLSSNLPHEFFLDFISQFYRIFKEHIDKFGFKRFVSEQFTDSLELYVNPQYNLNADNKKVTIHEEFLHRNYPKLSKFAARFDEWAKYEEDDKIKQIAMADNLTREQRVNRNRV
jgi:hypothetical protein